MNHATAWPSYVDKERLKASTSNDTQDLFIEKDGITCAGTHLILDVWKAHHLDDLALIERALRECIEVAGATLLHIHLHHFTPNGGVSGVAVLAESHISIHTWPERDYAALDIFMCGETEPMKCIPVLSKIFETDNIEVNTLLRGQIKNSNTSHQKTAQQETAP
jgi:S-adenosylmethionine decarboxylase